MIKVLLFTISLFIIFFLESFFLKVLSFSLFALLLITLWKRIGDIWFYILVTIIGIGLDTVLHIPLGTHILVISVLLILCDLLWIFIPKEGRYGEVPVFVFFVFYYLGILALGSLLQDRVFLDISIDMIVGILIKSLISVVLHIVVKHFSKSFRDNKDSGKIRLK